MKMQYFSDSLQNTNRDKNIRNTTYFVMRDYYVVILVIDIFAIQDTGANYKTCVFCNK